MKWVSVGLVATSLLGQHSTITAPGDNNVNVNKNQGTIVQVNVAPPSVTKQLKARVKEGHPWQNLLVPAHEPTPPNACSARMPTPPTDLLVILGGLGAAYCANSPCPIVGTAGDPTGPEDLLSVSREGSLMRVHAEIFGPDGRIEVAIENNKLLRNPANTLRWSRPDSHTLDVVDDRYRKTLHIKFINSDTIYVEGIFQDREGRRLIVESDKGIFGGGFVARGSCSVNARGAAFYMQ